MQSAYVEHKDLKDLYTRFALSFGSRSLDVYIWKSVRGLRRNTYFKTNDQMGAYVYYPYRKRRGLFGEIHLLKWMIGAGYVAHEIQHFMLDWLLDHKLTGATAAAALNEPMAKLAGDITRYFWNRYCQVVEREKAK